MAAKDLALSAGNDVLGAGDGGLSAVSRVLFAKADALTAGYKSLSASGLSLPTRVLALSAEYSRWILSKVSLFGAPDRPLTEWNVTELCRIELGTLETGLM